MKKVILLFSLFFIQQVMASWSGYVAITPGNQSNYDVNINSSVSATGICTLKFKAIGYPHKHAWLILTSSKLSSKEQALRDHIWGFENSPESLTLKTKLNPLTSKLEYLNDKNINNAYYEIKLSNQITHSAYVYIDFPRPVDDGGYYYSIDLGAYCGW